MRAFDFGSIEAIDIWTKDTPNPETASVYVKQEVSIAAVVAMTDLLCPRFVDVEGAVLLETSADPKGFQEWKEPFHGDTRAVESMLNHEHVWDLFPVNGEKDQAALEIVAEHMAITWKAAAGAQFPDRTFTCEVTDDYGPTLTIWTSGP